VVEEKQKLMLASLTKALAPLKLRAGLPRYFLAAFVAQVSRSPPGGFVETINSCTSKTSHAPLPVVVARQRVFQ